MLLVPRILGRGSGASQASRVPGFETEAAAQIKNSDKYQNISVCERTLLPTTQERISSRRRRWAASLRGTTSTSETKCTDVRCKSANAHLYKFLHGDHHARIPFLTRTPIRPNARSSSSNIQDMGPSRDNIKTVSCSGYDREHRHQA